MRRGMPNGLMAWIPQLGQEFPNSMVGLNELWKNVQKNDKKNIISEIINKIKPNFNKFKTLKVWFPWNVLSRRMSRDQKKKVKRKINKITKYIIFQYWVCIKLYKEIIILIINSLE